MDFIKNYRLEKNNDGYTLVLYLDMGLTEFANEFGSGSTDNTDKLVRDILAKFPNIRINTIKLMVGTLVVATIALQPIDGISTSFAASARQNFNMTYAYFESGSALMNTINNTGEVLDVISPGYFDLNPDGSLLLTRHFDPYSIKLMKEKGLRVVPFLANHWDRDLGRAALKNKKLLISQIVNIINQYNLDGINVDIENLTEVDRDEFVLFVKDLKEALPNKEVSVAVAANPRGYTAGYYGSFDYAKLAQIADYLMVMSYDEHYSGGATAGPVASIQFVENSIKEILKHAPPSKVVLGLPFFGRYWKDDGSIKGKGTSLIRINELVKKYNGTVFFDYYTKSPKAIVYIKGYEKDIPIGKYTFWFENEESILNKLKLIEKYNLKGAGSWSLHQATKDIWNVYNQWINSSKIFVDVGEGWAKPAIIAASEKGWMIGTRDFYFEPGKPLTRAQAASLLVRVLELNKTSTSTPYFKDVSPGHWAKNDIDIAVQNGLMVGQGNQIFAPDDSMTREEMAVLLSRLLKITPTSGNTKNPFKDINPNQWSYPFVLAMSESNIFEGYEDGTFRPKDKITREQMAALLDRIKDKI